jgi:hypothetical protein
LRANAGLPQVDRIIEYVPGKYAIGIKNVTVRAHALLGLAAAESRTWAHFRCLVWR